MRKIDANCVFGFWPKRKIDSSLDSLILRMDKAGIDRALVSSLHGIYNNFSEANEQTFTACEKLTERLIPVATVNPQSYYGVNEEIDRIVEKGCKIVRFWPHEQEWHIGQRHITKMLDKISQTDLAIMLPSTESVTAIGDFAKDIDNPVILETIRAYVQVAEIIAVASEVDNLYVETHMAGNISSFEILVEEIGAERLIFGSGAPFHSVSTSIMPIEMSDMSDENKSKIFSDNIKGILGL